MARDACPVRWKLADVKREIKILEPLANAQSRAAYVLMKLRGRWAVPQECEMVLLQGYVLHLHSLGCLLYTSPSQRDLSTARMPSSA